MNRLSLASASFALVLLASQVAQADAVDKYVKSQMEQHRIPGVALKIIQNGRAVKTAAYGLANLELNVPVKPETVFEIGSITKQFTAAGILLLAQDGKLSVDDSISKYLKDTPEAWRKVTIRHLLTHTSGIKSYTGLDGFQIWRHLTQAQFIQAIGTQPMEFQPGGIMEILQYRLQSPGLHHRECERNELLGFHESSESSARWGCTRRPTACRAWSSPIAPPAMSKRTMCGLTATTI